MEVILNKIIIKYLMMYMAFILGIVLFSIGVINLFSSLLLFVGGYESIKNTFDYRIVKRNMNSFENRNDVKLDVSSNINSEVNEDKLNKKELVSSIKPINYNVENMIGVKRIRRYGRVRRKY